MTNEVISSIEAPYLLLLGDVERKAEAKTALGLLHWAPERCAGQWRFGGSPVDLGLPDWTPEEAVRQGVKTAVVGVAPYGGTLPPVWVDALSVALECGLDIASGLHARLNDVPQLRDAATRHGARLIDVRVPPAGLPVATGARRSGRRLLTVGTDCASGKKYTALALTQSMLERGLKADFRATGQTGILIAGRGIPIDAVVSDFVAGAAEVLSPDNEPDHWDIVEGQGSLYHPSYAGVTLGLLHGTQPDAIVLCHDLSRQAIEGREDYPLPDPVEAIERYLLLGRLTNPDIRCIGVSVNSSALSEKDRRLRMQELESRLGLPCVDPLIDGADPLVDSLLSSVRV
jgi:uncharacterized NAD-dependent epimerase/dehydratase family protein